MENSLPAETVCSGRRAKSVAGQLAKRLTCDLWIQSTISAESRNKHIGYPGSIRGESPCLMAWILLKLNGINEFWEIILLAKNAASLD